MKTIRLTISYQSDREKIISALANSGYKVWVEEDFEMDGFTVCFDLPNKIHDK